MTDQAPTSEFLLNRAVSDATGLASAVDAGRIIDRVRWLLEHGETAGQILARLNPPAKPAPVLSFAQEVAETVGDDLPIITVHRCPECSRSHGMQHAEGCVYERNVAAAAREKRRPMKLNIVLDPDMPRDVVRIAKLSTVPSVKAPSVDEKPGNIAARRAVANAADQTAAHQPIWIDRELGLLGCRTCGYPFKYSGRGKPAKTCPTCKAEGKHGT